MKYLDCGLLYLILKKKMTKRIDSKKYDEYVRNRATATNIFKHNFRSIL